MNFLELNNFLNWILSKIYSLNILLNWILSQNFLLNFVFEYLNQYRDDILQYPKNTLRNTLKYPKNTLNNLKIPLGTLKYPKNTLKYVIFVIYHDSTNISTSPFIELNFLLNWFFWKFLNWIVFWIDFFNFLNWILNWIKFLWKILN